jgi:predicted nucleic acid-binding Zn ribbon protein
MNIENEKDHETTTIYTKYHWECPYCGTAYEDDAEPEETFVCIDGCNEVMKLKLP